MTTRPGGVVQVEWLLEFAQQLRGESGPGGAPSGLLSSFRVVPLPTPAARAEASAAPLPTQNSRGGRFSFYGGSGDTLLF